ncbi:MAG: type II secretion system F family protein [bacterium]|nr:type II secretion system F family protein [bacterium]
MTFLAAAWGFALLWGALLVHPRSTAVRARLGVGFPARSRRRARPVESLGRTLRATAGRPPDAGADRRAGSVVVALFAGAVIDISLGLAVAAVTWFVLRRRAASRRRREADAVLAELPEAVDLFALAASAGLSVRLATEAVAPRLGGPIGRALDRAVQQMRLGVEVAEALDALTRVPAGDALRLLVRPLTDSLRYGSALGPALERAAAVARAERSRQAEAAARRIPLRLLFPLTFCVLPAFVLLTIVPTVAQSLELVRF